MDEQRKKQAEEIAEPERPPISIMIFSAVGVSSGTGNCGRPKTRSPFPFP